MILSVFNFMLSLLEFKICPEATPLSAEGGRPKPAGASYNRTALIINCGSTVMSAGGQRPRLLRMAPAAFKAGPAWPPGHSRGCKLKRRLRTKLWLRDCLSLNVLSFKPA